MSDSMTKLVSVLGMMGSQHDGEILNAARFAERIRKGMNKTWQQLLSGASASSSDGELSMWKTRATISALEVAHLNGRVKSLERQIRELTATVEAKAKATASSSSSRPTGGDKYWLDPVKEKLLIERLLDMPQYPDDIYAITGWPRAHLRIVLGRIAKRRGFRLDILSARYGHGLRYCFHRT